MENDIKKIIETSIDMYVCTDEELMYPCATIDIYMEKPEQYGDGKANRTIGYVQVDLWCTDKDIRDAKIPILLKALENKYTYPTVHRFFDTTAQKHRATLQFSGFFN